MSRILTHCPNTGEVVRTNLTIDGQTYRLIAIDGFSFVCSACGEQHVWTKSDAWPEGDPVPYEAV